jgi:hypothetical protein
MLKKPWLVFKSCKKAISDLYLILMMFQSQEYQVAQPNVYNVPPHDLQNILKNKKAQTKAEDSHFIIETKA